MNGVFDGKDSWTSNLSPHGNGPAPASAADRRPPRGAPRRKAGPAQTPSDLPLASNSPRRQTPRTMKKTRFLVLAIVALHSFAAELRAQLEWDTDPLTPGIQGGTGNWLTANLWNNGTSNV